VIGPNQPLRSRKFAGSHQAQPDISTFVRQERRVGRLTPELLRFSPGRDAALPVVLLEEDPEDALGMVETED
jgi:hypothetical protein